MDFSFPRITFRSDLLFRDLGDEGIILDPDKGLYYRLNDLGVRVLREVSGGPESDLAPRLVKLAENVAAECDVELPQVLRDMEEFAVSLRMAKLCE